MRTRLAQYFVKQFYGRLAGAYDLAVWAISGGLWHRWGLLAEQYVRGEPVIEVGCGTGRLLEHLARKGVNVVGVDLSPEMLSLARRRLDRLGPKCRLLRADAAVLPLADGSVGTIVTIMPSGYAAQETTWREFARVLRPGGRWVIVSGPRPNRPHPRLAGLYLLRLIEQGYKALRRAGVSVTIPSSLFPRQVSELKPVGSIPVLVVLLDKD
jgi:ubiquinone/menaquinone biosynthesis C-methylase UbiE